MLGRFGSRTPDSKHESHNADAAAQVESAPEVVSVIGPGMSITGNIACDAPLQIYGRIEGELRAKTLEIGDSALVEGDIVAQELTVRGRVKGTIRAVRVKLQGNGIV